MSGHIRAVVSMLGGVLEFVLQVCGLPFCGRFEANYFSTFIFQDIHL